MSTRRPGTCREPGPYAAHCTDNPGHRYSCYDAGDDVSWNDGQWYDFDLAPHDCGDPACPDQGYRGPEGRESEYGQVTPCSNDVECDADEHIVACPSRHRSQAEPTTLADRCEPTDEVLASAISKLEATGFADLTDEERRACVWAVRAQRAPAPWRTT